MDIYIDNIYGTINLCKWKCKLIYSEILRYICLLCILTNSVKWKKNHKKICKSSFDKIAGKVNILYVNDKLANGDETWNISVFQKTNIKVYLFLIEEKFDKVLNKCYNTDLELYEIDGLNATNLSQKSVKSFAIEKYRELTYYDKKKEKKQLILVYIYLVKIVGALSVILSDVQ